MFLVFYVILYHQPLLSNLTSWKRWNKFYFGWIIINLIMIRTFFRYKSVKQTYDFNFKTTSHFIWRQTKFSMRTFLRGMIISINFAIYICRHNIFELSRYQSITELSFRKKFGDIKKTPLIWQPWPWTCLGVWRTDCEVKTLGGFLREAGVEISKNNRYLLYKVKHSSQVSEIINASEGWEPER